MVRVALDRPAQPTVYPAGLGRGHQNGSNGQGNQGTSTRREGIANQQDPNSLQCFRCQGWGSYGQGMPYPSNCFKPAGGTKGIQLIHLLVKAATANSRPLTFPPQPWTNASQYEGSLTNRPMRIHPSHSIFDIQTPLPAWLDDPMRPL